MRIVVIGAYGLVGGYVAARLSAGGHAILGVGRDVRAARRRFPALRWAQADLRRMGPGDWGPILAGADAVVNCAGALQDSPRDDLEAVHARAVAGLVEACDAAGVRRIVQVSAAGVEAGLGRFGRTKRAAEQALRQSRLDWAILRPALVIAPAAYGGGGLLRGLAGFPGFIPAVNPQSVVQTVFVDDLAEAVAQLVQPEAPARISFDLAAPEETRLGDVLVALRAWLGLPPARIVAVPAWAGRLCARIADALALLGWRSPMRSAALEQLAAGVKADGPAPAELGVSPRSLEAALARWPAGVQERWFARLYFAKPLALASLAAFWLLSGAIGIAHSAAAARLLADTGLARGPAQALVVLGGLADMAVGAMACARRSAPLALKGMLLLSTLYLAAGAVLAPSLWADPLGPMLKVVPAAVLALAVLAMMDER